MKRTDIFERADDWNARGDKLFEHPERAKVFYEWAAAKDRR